MLFGKKKTGISIVSMLNIEIFSISYQNHIYLNVESCQRIPPLFSLKFNLNLEILFLLIFRFRLGS